MRTGMEGKEMGQRFQIFLNLSYQVKYSKISNLFQFSLLVIINGLFRLINCFIRQLGSAKVIIEQSLQSSLARDLRFIPEMAEQQFKKSLFTETSQMKIQLFLQKNKQFDPRQCVRPNNSNILHHLSYEGKKQLIELYLNHTYNMLKNKSELQESEGKPVKQKVADWINQKNNDGFTPLLYACFNGHVEIIDVLIVKGANFAAKNNAGLGPLHLAAQNNKVSTLIYFRDKLDINEPDTNGITPLHWASSNGSEDAVAYMLTLEDIELDKKDKEGQTPLILATSFGNTKIVRRLLIRGAQRAIKSDEGKTALQIAQESQFENIRKMLDDRPSCFDFLKFYYNVKVQYKPQTRSLKIPVVFIITALCAILILNTQLVFKEYWIYIVQGVVIGLMLVLYLSLLSAPDIPDRLPLDPLNVDRICFECTFKRPKRGYHCDICGTCIEQYDHHCTWINNCVGKRNLARFIIFIFFLLLSLLIIGASGVLGLLKTLQVLDSASWTWIQLRFEKEEEWRKWATVGLFSINMAISLFFIPVLLLFFVQVKNILINKTTYERVRGVSTRRSSTGQTIQNCKTMCMKNRQSFISQQSAGDQLLSH